MMEKLKRSPLLQKLGGESARKYLALGLVCLLLLGSLLAVPRSGSAAAPDSGESSVPTKAPEAPAPEPPMGLVPAAGLELLPGESLFGLCREGERAAALLLRRDQEALVWRGRLALLDPERSAAVEWVELEPLGELGSFTTLALTEGEIRLADRQGERCAAFDRSGRFLGLKDHPAMSQENLGWRNRLLGDDCFRKEAGWGEFTRSDSGPLNQAVIFYDETDRLHLIHEPYDRILDAEAHRLLTLRLGEGEGGELALLDLDATRCLDRLSLEDSEAAPEGWRTLDQALLGGDWALLALSRSREGETEQRLFFWYPRPEAGSPLEAELLTEQMLWDEIGLLQNRLTQAGLVLRVEQSPDPALIPASGPEAEAGCRTDASLFGQYWILSLLADFAEKLPPGMIPELSRELPGGGPTDLGALEIYIVRSIPGEASAFASLWAEPPVICFATEEFDPSQIPHEFMHIMDLRLSRWLESQGRSLEGEWAALSPDYAFEEALSQERRESLEGYFVSLYARTNSGEDRAECFRALFESEEPLAEQWWYAGKAGVQSKLLWLCQSLRAAFPSLQGVERASWEKLPPQ